MRLNENLATAQRNLKEKENLANAISKRLNGKSEAVISLETNLLNLSKSNSHLETELLLSKEKLQTKIDQMEKEVIESKHLLEVETELLLSKEKLIQKIDQNPLLLL